MWPQTEIWLVEDHVTRKSMNRTTATTPEVRWTSTFNGGYCVDELQVDISGQYWWTNRRLHLVMWRGITSPAIHSTFRQCCHGNQTRSHAPTAMTAFQHLQLSISHFVLQFGSLRLKFHPFQASNPGRLGHWPLSKTRDIYNRSGTKPYHHAAFITCLQ